MVAKDITNKVRICLQNIIKQTYLNILVSESLCTLRPQRVFFFFNADYIYHFFFILEMKAEKGLKQTSTQVYISISQQSNYITCHLAAGNFYCRFGKKWEWSRHILCSYCYGKNIDLTDFPKGSHGSLRKLCTTFWEPLL